MVRVLNMKLDRQFIKQISQSQPVSLCSRIEVMENLISKNPNSGLLTSRNYHCIN